MHKEAALPLLGHKRPAWFKTTCPMRRIAIFRQQAKCDARSLGPTAWTVLPFA
jgi:hypothetical protein